MIGNDTSGPGVMVLTMRDLFQAVDDKRSECKFKLSISYLEIYNETIRDLFTTDSPPLALLEDPVRGATVAGLSQRNPSSAEEVFNQRSQPG